MSELTKNLVSINTWATEDELTYLKRYNGLVCDVEVNGMNNFTGEFLREFVTSEFFKRSEGQISMVEYMLSKVVEKVAQQPTQQPKEPTVPVNTLSCEAKIPWEDQPDMRWWAVDNNGGAWFYKEKPVIDRGTWVGEGACRDYTVNNNGGLLFWHYRSSLMERPKPITYKNLSWPTDEVWKYRAMDKQGIVHHFNNKPLLSFGKYVMQMAGEYTACLRVWDYVGTAEERELFASSVVERPEGV